MKWYKTSDTLTIDPALALVAAKSKCYRHEVIAAWVHFMECAAKHRSAVRAKEETGYLGNLDFEEIDLALELIPGKAKKIYDMLVERKKIVDNCIVNWRKHQLDPTAAERKAAQREREEAAKLAAGGGDKSRNVTVTNSDVTLGTGVTLEEKRPEENNIKTPLSPSNVDNSVNKKAVGFNSFAQGGIIRALSEKGLQAAKDAVPGLDIYELAKKYDEGIEARGGMPLKPDMAFAAWCKSYTKGQAA